MSAGLRAEGLTVRLGGALVLRGVNIAAQPGEVLGVFGPSGAGKSTLFRALAGEERTEAGRVLVAGLDVTKLPLWERARRGLGYVAQTPSVLYDLSVEENFATFERLAPRPMAPARDRASAGALMDALGLTSRAKVRASSLSGGERRRLELGRALFVSPAVLLCDEPFAAVDPRGAEAAGALLRGAARDGAAVVLADHHVAEALGICDRAALLLDGEIVVDAAPDAFREHPLVRKHYAIVA